MHTTIRLITSLDVDELRALARELADAGQPLEHALPAGSAQAIALEHAYVERQRELQAQE